MVEKSVARRVDERAGKHGDARPSTRGIVADEGFCGQAAAVLLCDEEPIRKALLGEPLKEALAMVEWALAHEDDEGFDPARALPSWAQRRKKGAWSTGPRRFPRKGGRDPGEGRAEELARTLAAMWVEHPESLAGAIRALEEQRDGNGRS